MSNDNYIDTPTVLFQFEIQGADDVLNTIASFKDRLESAPLGEISTSNNLVTPIVSNRPNNGNIPYSRNNNPTATVLKRQLAISDNNSKIALSKVKLQQEINKGKRIAASNQLFSVDKMFIGLQASQEATAQKNAELAIWKEKIKKTKLDAQFKDQLTSSQLALQKEKTKQIKEKIKQNDNLYKNKEEYELFKDKLKRMQAKEKEEQKTAKFNEDKINYDFKQQRGIKDRFFTSDDRIRIENKEKETQNDLNKSGFFNKMYQYITNMERSTKNMESNFKNMESTSNSFIKSFTKGFKDGLMGYNSYGHNRGYRYDPIQAAGYEIGELGKNIKPALQIVRNPVKGIAMGLIINTLGQLKKEEKISKMAEILMTDPQLSTSEGHNSIQDAISYAMQTINMQEVKKDLKSQRVADLDFEQSIMNLTQGLIQVKNDFINEDNKNLKFTVDPKTGTKKASIVKDADLDPDLRAALDFIKFSRNYTTDDQAINYLRDFGMGDGHSLSYEYFNSDEKHIDQGDIKTSREILGKLQQFIPQLTWNSAAGGNIFFAANPMIDKNTGKPITVLLKAVKNVLEATLASTAAHIVDPKTHKITFKKDDKGDYIYRNIVDDKSESFIKDIVIGGNLTTSGAYIESTGNVEILHTMAKTIRGKSQEVMQGLHLTFNVMDDMMDGFINFVSGGNDYIEKASKKEERDQAVKAMKDAAGKRYSIIGY